MNYTGRKKITELYEERFRTKEYRDADGKLQRTPVPYRGARLVQVVTGWDRFWHYIIDSICVGIIGFVIGLIFTLGQIGFGSFSFQNGHFEINLVGSFLGLGFYFLFELLTGSTPGKMLLGRVVINEYAEKPEAGAIAIRTISRWVPFEAFSCLGDRGWHDRWSDTFVVNKKEAALLYDLRIEQEKEEVQNISEQYRANQDIPTSF